MISFQNKNLINALSRVSELRKKVRRGFQLGLSDTKNEYTKTIRTGSRSGKPYAITYRGRLIVGRHSTPNEPIGNITGRTADKSYFNTTATEGIIGSKAPYSGIPEDGAGLVAPRKTAKKIVDKNLKLISSSIEKAVLK